MDELILRTIQQDGVDTILNLGAGLDTRPYRLPLPASLHWIEVDLPVVLDYKASKLSHAQPTCGLESIALDLSDAVARRALLRQITGVANQVLVLTEGVLAYMTAKQVAELAIELHAQPQLGWWLIDLFSPQALHLQQQHLGQTLPGKTVNLQFAPPEGIEFFQTSGWQAIETRSSFAEGQRLQRGALSEAVLAQLSQEQLQILHQLCRFVLLARVNESSN
jgi:methyltransferase (TIGR00027 family)